MHARDYEILAGAFRNTFADQSTMHLSFRQMERMLSYFIKELKADNPRFDEDTFLRKVYD